VRWIPSPAHGEITPLSCVTREEVHRCIANPIPGKSLDDEMTLIPQLVTLASSSIDESVSRGHSVETRRLTISGPSRIRVMPLKSCWENPSTVRFDTWIGGRAPSRTEHDVERPFGCVVSRVARRNVEQYGAVDGTTDQVRVRDRLAKRSHARVGVGKGIVRGRVDHEPSACRHRKRRELGGPIARIVREYTLHRRSSWPSR
jgi:hypothetical protein